MAVNAYDRADICLAYGLKLFFFSRIISDVKSYLKATRGKQVVFICNKKPEFKASTSLKCKC